MDHPPSLYTMTSDAVRVLRLVQQHTPLAACANMTGIGLERRGELVAGVIYEGYNGRNIWMHVAIPGCITRDFLRYAFHYPFIELGCRRVSGYVEASNARARRFDEHLGFQQEAILQGAASDGGDVILYRMTREDCRYVAHD